MLAPSYQLLDTIVWAISGLLAWGMTCRDTWVTSEPFLLTASSRSTAADMAIVPPAILVNARSSGVAAAPVTNSTSRWGAARAEAPNATDVAARAPNAIGRMPLLVEAIGAASAAAASVVRASSLRLAATSGKDRLGAGTCGVSECESGATQVKPEAQSSIKLTLGLQVCLFPITMRLKQHLRSACMIRRT